MFLTLYYTDSVGISAGIVGTIMPVTRIFDGITDLVFGNILDRTNTKWGKAKPWLMAAPPMLAIGVILLFNVPGSLSDVGKIVYATITYVFITTIAYTIGGLSYSALLSLMTNDTQARTSASSIRFLLVTIVCVVLAAVTMPLVNSVGWSGVSLIYATGAAICLLLTIFGTKERYVPIKKTEAGFII